MLKWTPRLTLDGAPRYLQLADAIARDVALGRLAAGDRLPPQRALAARLGVDFTTVSRGYTEARRRGLVQAQVGRGTFVAPPADPEDPREPRRRVDADLTMNLPPEPSDPALLARMKAGLDTVAANLVDLLRYQSSTGGQVDKEAASSWLSLRGMVPSLDRIAVTPGAHPTMLAILMRLTRPGDTVLCEAVTYPGIRGLAARMEVRLVGLPGDADGIDPDALSQAIRAHRPKALYLNPTINNPTTRTMPLARRQEVAEVLIRHGLPLIEDDAYGFIPPSPPSPIATLAPDLVWHIGGLAKCIGAGLRLAYTVAPDRQASLDLAQHLKSISVMPSPLSMALATRWIVDGTADTIRRFIRVESLARQGIAAEILSRFSFDADPHAFNIWLRLPEGRARAEVIGRMSGSGIGLMPSDAFTVAGPPAEAIRVCLCGRLGRAELRHALGHLENVLSTEL